MADKKNLIPKNLVIVRAGDNSLHEGWLEGTRNWDLIVSGYGETSKKWQRHDITHIFYKGGKFDGIYDAFQQVPGLLDKYDYIMMADDDFIMTAQDINRLFDIMREHNLQIGHPSFSHQSYGLYFPAYHNPRFKIRFTNFVENGVACLHRSVWQQILPLYQDNPMGYYIDNFWGRLTDDPVRQVALIDEIQVTHSRLYESGGLHRKMKQFGWQEEGPVQYHVPNHTPDWDKWRLPKIVCHAAIDADAHFISGRKEVLPLLADGWREIKKNISAAQIYENRSAQQCVDLAIENQKTGRSNLSKTRISVMGHKDQLSASNISLMKNSDKKNLLIVRAGDNSLHEGWLEGERNWDIIVSCYGDRPHIWKRNDIIFLFYPGGKGDGIYDAFQKIPGLLDKYDYIMMADDDFKMTADDINRTFDIMREHNLQIGQPSFSHESYILYHAELHNPMFKIRFSNFVEAITVCLSVNIWRQILPLYQNNPIGWYIDNYWARLTDDPARQIAFIDEVQITHTRPCQSGDIYDYGWSDQGPVQYSVPDHKSDWDKWRLPKVVCHAGILANNQKVRGRWAMLSFLLAGWIKAAKHINRTQIFENRSMHKCIRRSLANQITGIFKPTKTSVIVHGTDQQTPRKPHEAFHRNLVIVRAGDRSLHEGWLKGQRNWDIIISNYGENPEKWQRHDAQRNDAQRDDIKHIIYPGGKGDGLYDVFQQMPDLLEQYDYIMMADDDFKMTARDINRTFDIMREHNLQIGQPSFSYQSHVLYFPQVHNPRFKIRFSNFVEASTVCLSANVWRQILPLYQNNPIGWFIDNFWARLTDDPTRQVAFIDEVQVTHTRPFGGGELYDKQKKQGWSEAGPVQYHVPDYQPDHDKWDLVKIVCHAGILKDSSFISSRDEMLPHLISGWREAAKYIKRSQMRRNRSVRRCIKSSIKNQRTGTSNLAKTHIVIEPQKTAAELDPAQPPQEP